MKIRTGFVTNSSSYSSAEIKIDNPVLLKILEKYKEIDAFADTYVEEGICVKDDTGKKYAVLFEDVSTNEIAPRNLSSVAQSLIDLFVYMIEREWDCFEDETIEKCFNEIKEQIHEIENNYKSVEWVTKISKYGEDQPSWAYIIDKYGEAFEEDDPNLEEFGKKKDKNGKIVDIGDGKEYEDPEESYCDLDLEMNYEYKSKKETFNIFIY